MKASIIAVGTELTTGQITNKNAVFISEKLNSLGINTVLHLTVPDDRVLILKALEMAEEQADFIIVTGGLGPTSDDFTREIIGTWLDEELIFHEPSWLHVQQRLTLRGFKILESQRQQCYFPRSAAILSNSAGTANAFFVKPKKPSGIKNVFVLPGPPAEIKEIWADHVVPFLSTLPTNLNKKRTTAWDTLGKAESEVATLVEAQLINFSNPTAVVVGYRVHLPYVEVKISYLELHQKIIEPLIKKIDAVLKEITITKNFLDVAGLVADKVKNLDFAFYDTVSKGYLHRRLQPFLQKNPSWSWKQTDEFFPADFFANEENFLALLPLEDVLKSLLLANYNGQKMQKVIESPFALPLMFERKNQYFAELALVYFLRHFA